MQLFCVRSKTFAVLLLVVVSQGRLFAQLGLSGSQVYLFGQDREALGKVSAFQGEVFYAFAIPGVKSDTVPRNHITISPAYQYHYIGFANNVAVNRSGGLTSFQELSEPDVEYRRSNLYAWGLQLRTQLNLENKEGNGYAAYRPGFYANDLISGRFKRRYDVGSERKRLRSSLSKDNDFYGLKRLQIGHFGTFNMGLVSLWYGVSFTPLFVSGNGPMVRELRFGALIGIPIRMGDGAKARHVPMIAL